MHEYYTVRSWQWGPIFQPLICCSYQHNTASARLYTSQPFLNPCLIYLKQQSRIIECKHKLKLCKSREVDLFHLQGCESEHKFLARKHDWHFSLFMSSAPDHRKNRKLFPSKHLQVLFPNTNEFICVHCSLWAAILTNGKSYSTEKRLLGRQNRV